MQERNNRRAHERSEQRHVQQNLTPGVAQFSNERYRAVNALQIKIVDSYELHVAEKKLPGRLRKKNESGQQSERETKSG